MSAEIVPDAAAGAGLFAPTLARFGAVAVVVRFEDGNIAESFFGEQFAEGEVVAIPAAALERGEQALGAAGFFD